MKKIIVLVVAVLMCVTLASCGNSSLVNEAVNASKAEKIKDMTYAAAAGGYSLSQMTEIGKDEYKINVESYAENALTLSDDGTATLNIRLNDGNSDTASFTSKYEISDNGIITFEDGFAVVAAGEQVICNGKRITISGNLGAQLVVNSVYEKTVSK